MKLKAGAYFLYQVAEPTPMIAMLRPRSNDRQFIQEDRLQISPFVPVNEYTDSFGNLCHRMMLDAGEISIKTEVLAEVEDTVAEDVTAAYVLIENLPSDVLQYLLPSRYCPSDSPEIAWLARSITQNIVIGYEQVQAFRNWIYKNINYQYGVTFSSTTALDILNNRMGVCRDFSHLGISLCRSMNIPARMVVGYLKNLAIMDLHAWFEAYLGDKWYTFDAVEEITTAGRIVVAYGRDATDVALITQFGNAFLKSMNVWVEKIV
jgi:transglutaminase-like putative cysteine protease